MKIFNKLIPVSVLALLQIGCATQNIYQEPAPVQRHQSKLHRQESSTSVETYKYPESENTRDKPKMQEIAPQAQTMAPPNVSSRQLSPAVLALVSEADQNSQAGEYESAAVKIERALRIDSRNATLTYKLAAIRLKQEQPRLAEDLAKKAALLAGADRELKKRIWLLIAESKRLQKDPEGALQAEQKAGEY